MDLTIVMLNGDSHLLRVNPEDTVGSLKQRIQDTLRVSCETQKLVFENGQKVQLSDDLKPLSQYDLYNGAKVFLLLQTPPTSKVQTPPTIQVQTPPTIKVQTPPTIQVQTPPTIKVQTPPTIKVQTPPTIQVFLKDEKGKSTPYDIKPDETVSNFKSKVESKQRVPVCQQSLSYESRVMTEGKLSDYGVKNNGTIYLSLRLRGG